MEVTSALAGRTPSKTMEAFADFLIAKVYPTGLPKGFDEKAFRAGVDLGGSVRGYFQASDEWKADSRNYLANVESRKAERDATRLAKAEESARKAIERAAKAKAAAKASADAKAAKEAATAKASADAEANAPKAA